MNNDKIDILLSHSDMTNFNKYHNNNNKLICDIIDGNENCNAFVNICGHFHARYGVKVRQNFIIMIVIRWLLIVHL